jgi:hypothetical protein
MAGHPFASTVLPTVRGFAWEGHQIAKFCWVQCGIGSQGSFDIDNNNRTPQADKSTAQTALRSRCYTDCGALADLAQASRSSVHSTNRLAMLLRGGHYPPLVVCDIAHGKEEDGSLEPRTRLLVEYGMTAKTRSGGNTPTEMAMRKEARVQPPVVVKIEPQTMPAMQQSSAPSAPMQMPTFPQQQQDPPMMTNFNNTSQSSSYIDPILAVQHMSMSSNNPVNMFQPTPQQQQQPPQYSGGNVGQSMNRYVDVASLLTSERLTHGSSSQSTDAPTQPAHVSCQPILCPHQRLRHAIRQL